MTPSPMPGMSIVSKMVQSRRLGWLLCILVALAARYLDVQTSNVLAIESLSFAPPA